jgi:hypothetical protein
MSATIVVGMTPIQGSFGITLARTTVHYTRKAKTMDKLGKVIPFHPVKSPLSLFYEVIEPDGETRWGGERAFDAISWLHLAPKGSRLLVSGWESDDLDAQPVGQPLDVTEMYQLLKGVN